MSSTLILISLMLALSVAVIFPEFQYSSNSKQNLGREYEFMVNKQRKGFLIIGLGAISTFFVSIQLLSVPLYNTSFVRYSFWSLCIYCFSS